MFLIHIRIFENVILLVISKLEVLFNIYKYYIFINIFVNI